MTPGERRELIVFATGVMLGAALAFAGLLLAGID